jgi:hypothetical protein
MRRLLPVPVILSFVLASGVAVAQSSQTTDTIPKELVTLLLRGPGGYPGENFDIKIGAPANFPSDLLPTGVTPAVSTTSDRMVTVVAEAPRLTAADLLRHERALTAAGWTNPSSMSMRGLMSSTMAPAMQICKGDQYATVSYATRPAGGMYVRISLTTDPRRGSCVAMARPMVFFADVDLPQLFPPATAQAINAGSSSSPDSHEQRIRLETKLSTDAVVSHYTEQLTNAGWKREASLPGDGIAVAKLTSISTTKEAVVALITATTIPGATQMDVTLRLLRVDPNRRFPGRSGGAGVIAVCCL